ncbi:MAG: SIS domain-containing protein [Planctomycetia bacterium]|jgi:arabinose-5-phosphate isomerase
MASFKSPSCSSAIAFDRFCDCASSAIADISRSRDEILKTASLTNEARCIYSCGVGKMSFIAGKFAASLRSVGVEAHFLDATHLAHGDLGVIRKHSTAVLFSKSGNSSELKAIAPFLKALSVTVILVSGSPRSPLAQYADLVIHLPGEQEGDTHNLLPLCSTLSAMAVADVIVSIVADQRKFDANVFAANHPAGQIGLNLNRRVEDLVAWRARTPFICPNATIADAMEAIGVALCGLACVVSKGTLVAIVSDGDLRRALIGNVAITDPVEMCWNRNPVTVDVTFTLKQVYDLMEHTTKKVNAAPVVTGTDCLGVMTIHDLF